MEKTPRKKAVFSVARWAPLNEALVRAKEALSSSDLAERDLHEHLQSRRLPSAMRCLARGDAQTFEHLKPSFWKGLTLLETSEIGSDGIPKKSGKVQVRGPGVEFIARLRLQAWFFVARSDLDKLYPAGAARPDDNDSEPMKRSASQGRGRSETGNSTWQARFGTT